MGVHLRGTVGRLFLGALLAGCTSAVQTEPDAVPAAADSAVLRVVRAAAHPLTGDTRDYDPLMAAIGDASFVLLGEATHGTHEFYRERARITQRLVREKGFAAVVVEGSWPDADRANRWVRGMGTDATAEQALSGFTGFPQWMWPNTDVHDLVGWLRTHDQGQAPETRVGFYGMDLYSLFTSADAVVRDLERIDPEAARRARERYRCFDRFGDDPQAYGRAAAERTSQSCQRQAREQFQEIEQRFGRPDPREDATAAELRLAVLQNARAVRNGEEYYRTAYEGGISSWNLRDRHMADALGALAEHLGARGRPAKVVVWAHNTHMGDARVTEPGAAGEWNVGQLMREQHQGEAFLVGFTTYAGTVFAAEEWGGRGAVRQLRPALPESYSALFHQAGRGDFLLVFRGDEELRSALAGPRLERAVGVIYLPRTERASHYFLAKMSEQFDAVIHWDTTRAITPLRR